MAKGKNKKFYEELRAVDARALAHADAKEILAGMKTKKVDGASNETVVGLLIAAKVAHQTNFDEFEAFLESGELPSLKLTNEEMKTLRGGINWGKVLGVGLAVGGAALIGYGLYKSAKGSGEAGLNKGFDEAKLSRAPAESNYAANKIAVMNGQNRNIARRR